MMSTAMTDGDGQDNLRFYLVESQEHGCIGILAVCIGMMI